MTLLHFQDQIRLLSLERQCVKKLEIADQIRFLELLLFASILRLSTFLGN